MRMLGDRGSIYYGMKMKLDIQLSSNSPLSLNLRSLTKGMNLPFVNDQGQIALEEHFEFS